MDVRLVVAGAFLLAIPVLYLLLSSRPNKGSAGGEKEVFTEGLLAALGRFALIEYTPTERFESVTKKVLSKSLESGRQVVLITQAPRTRIYLEGNIDYVDSGRLKIVSITSENPLARLQMFRVGKQQDTVPSEADNTLTNVSINNLEFAVEIIEGLAPDGVLIFEALSGIILGLGAEKKEAAYKFFSSIVEGLSEKDRTLVALLNSGAHEKETVSAYEGLFMRIFKIDEGRLVSLKCEPEAINIDISG